LTSSTGASTLSSRSTNASMTQSASVSTPLSMVPAANETDAANIQVPESVPDSNDIREFQHEAAEIPVADVKPLPRNVAQWLFWIMEIQAMAWGDREALSRVDIDNKRVTVPAIN